METFGWLEAPLHGKVMLRSASAAVGGVSVTTAGTKWMPKSPADCWDLATGACLFQREADISDSKTDRSMLTKLVA